MDSIVDKTGNTKVKRNRWVGFRLGLQREQDPVPLLRSEKRGKADFVFVSISVGNRHRGVQTYFHHHIIDHYIIPQHGKSRQPKPGRSIMLPSPSCNPPRSYFIFSIMILHLKKMSKSWMIIITHDPCCCCPVTKSCLTLCDPMDCSTGMANHSSILAPRMPRARSIALHNAYCPLLKKA